MSTKKRWTKEEDEILVQAIKANPHNLSKAFREVSLKLERTETAINYRWYYVLKNKSVCFMTVSPNKTLSNGKISTNNKVDKTPKTFWQKIKEFFK